MFQPSKVYSSPFFLRLTPSGKNIFFAIFSNTKTANPIISILDTNIIVLPKQIIIIAIIATNVTNKIVVIINILLSSRPRFFIKRYEKFAKQKEGMHQPPFLLNASLSKGISTITAIVISIISIAVIAFNLLCSVFITGDEKLAIWPIITFTRYSRCFFAKTFLFFIFFKKVFKNRVKTPETPCGHGVLTQNSHVIIFSRDKKVLKIRKNTV